MMMDMGLSARGPLIPQLHPMAAGPHYFPMHVRPRFCLDGNTRMRPAGHLPPPAPHPQHFLSPPSLMFSRHPTPGHMPPMMIHPLPPPHASPTSIPSAFPPRSPARPSLNSSAKHVISSQGQGQDRHIQHQGQGHGHRQYVTSSPVVSSSTPSSGLSSSSSSSSRAFHTPSPKGRNASSNHGGGGSNPANHFSSSSTSHPCSPRFPPVSPMSSCGGFPSPLGVGDPGLFAAGIGGYGGWLFTMEEMDMVLYGYAKARDIQSVATSGKDGKDVEGGDGKTKGAPTSTGHALSGLRIGELSYGIDRILGSGSSPSGSSASKAASVISAASTHHHLVDPDTIDLPTGLELRQNTFAGTIHYGIFCNTSAITKGTKFGPFKGKVVNTSEIKTNDDNTHMWEIFEGGKLSHFIDGRGSMGNWLAYVNMARYAQEQNLTAMQIGTDIYYESCKDITQGTELLVWYGESYLQFMGIPVSLKEMADTATDLELERSEGYKCERCGKVFAYEYYRDKHLKYTRCVDQGDRKFPCHLCTRSFEKRDRLRIHILHVHEKHRPHKCTVCQKSFSQSSSLNKHMRVHSGERPYKCVYCSKAFTASSILRTHIRQHSGEKPFKCKHCGKAFASHAAHDSHVRRTHPTGGGLGGGGIHAGKERSADCPVCRKSFAQIYELKFHMRTHELDDSGNSSFGEKFVDDAEIDVVGGMV